MVREAASELAGEVAVVQVNTQENPALAARYGVRGIPAVLLLQKGAVVDSLNGAVDRATLVSWCRSRLRR